jgi:hypothetical protein
LAQDLHSNPVDENWNKAPDTNYVQDLSLSGKRTWEIKYHKSETSDSKQKNPLGAENDHKKTKVNKWPEDKVFVLNSSLE